MELDPRTTAVIAVHLQGDIVGPDGAFAGLFQQQVAERDVLGVTGQLLAATRTAGSLVVYLRVAWKPDYSDLDANSPLLTAVIDAGCLTDGSPNAEIVSEVKPEPDDHIITHQRVGGFANSDLHTLLQSNHITTTVFTGVATNVSVEGTARVASDLGYRVLIVEDACSAGTLSIHQASIESLGLLAEIAASADVTAALTASTGTPT